MNSKKAQITMALVCFLLSFVVTMQVKSVIKNEESAQSDQLLRVEDMQKELVRTQEKNIDLEKQLVQAKNDLAAYRKAAEESSSGAKALSGELGRLQVLSGMTDVTGPGVVVTLNDSQALPDVPVSDPSSYILHDSDLRTIVNELCAAGAEAISINGERLVATSEIRCVGPTVIVNGNKYAPPYEIKAIGDADMLEAALNIKGGVAEELRFFKIEVSIAKSDQLTIGKYNGIVNFKYAKNAETASE